MDMNKTVQRSSKIRFIEWLVSFALLTVVMSAIFAYAGNLAFADPDWPTAIFWGAVFGFFGSFSYVFYFKKSGQ